LRKFIYILVKYNELISNKQNIYKKNKTMGCGCKKRNQTQENTFPQTNINQVPTPQVTQPAPQS